jgi:hypothetical protein
MPRRRPHRSSLPRSTPASWPRRASCWTACWPRRRASSARASRAARRARCCGTWRAPSRTLTPPSRWSPGAGGRRGSVGPDSVQEALDGSCGLGGHATPPTRRATLTPNPQTPPLQVPRLLEAPRPGAQRAGRVGGRAGRPVPRGGAAAGGGGRGAQVGRGEPGARAAGAAAKGRARQQPLPPCHLRQTLPFPLPFPRLPCPPPNPPAPPRAPSATLSAVCCSRRAATTAAPRASSNARPSWTAATRRRAGRAPQRGGVALWCAGVAPSLPSPPPPPLAQSSPQLMPLPQPKPQAWNMLGLCRVSMGDIRDGLAAYEKAVELAPDMREAWLNMGQVNGWGRWWVVGGVQGPRRRRGERAPRQGHRVAHGAHTGPVRAPRPCPMPLQALKEEGRTREAERTLTRLIAEPRQPGGIAAYRLLAQMRQGQVGGSGTLGWTQAGLSSAWVPPAAVRPPRCPRGRFPFVSCALPRSARRRAATRTPSSYATRHWRSAPRTW